MSPRKRYAQHRCLWLLLTILLLATMAWAQAAQGVLTGTVMDSSSLPVPDAQVFAQEVVTKASTTVTTDANGVYSLKMPPGTYAVKVSRTGFSEREQEWKAVADQTRKKSDP